MLSLNSFRKFFLLVAILLLSNCSYKINTYGYLPQKEIKIGMEKSLVRQIYGAPAFIDKNTWYYVEIKTRIDNLGIKKSYSARISKITFDSHEKVKLIENSEIKNLSAHEVYNKSNLDKDKFSINKRILAMLGNLAPSL